ncbi:MAG: GDP-mannose 4,6-dehydratase [Patescibacteria group bacterium]
MRKTAFITGILGQDGPYLAKLLLGKGYEVYGLIRRYSNPNFSNTDYLEVTDRINFVMGDMIDESSLMNIIKTIQPDEVYNLAAQSFVGSSWDQARLTTEVNSLGVLYLLNAVKSFAPRAKFYQASTSEMFGNSSQKSLQNEDTPFHPRSPYAISKLYAHWIVNNFKESHGMYCVNGILFNHESPIRGREFVTRKISEGVAKIKLGLAKEIRLGNLNSKRDWGYAGDYVVAMWLMLQQPKPDNYIISTGENHSVEDFAREAFSYAGISDWKKYIKIDPQFKRPAELFTLCGKSDKARKILGWKPKVGFKKIVAMMVQADLDQLSNNLRNTSARKI